MKHQIDLMYSDGTQKYKFVRIEQNSEGSLVIIPALFNSESIGNKGNHFTYHKNGYYNTTLQSNNGFNFSLKGPTLKPISKFKGLMQVMCLGKGAFEASLLKIARAETQEVAITKNALDKIQEPNINILLLELGRKDLLENQKPYSSFLKEDHILHYFIEFNPWVVLLVGSGISAEKRSVEQPLTGLK